MVFKLKRIPLGPTLVFIGVFGGGLLWIFLCGLRFDYLITEVYNGDPGEAIWSLDPLFTILAAIPAIILILVGLIVSVHPGPERPAESKPRMDHQKLNLFYIGEICLLVASIASFIGFLGISSLIVEVRVSAIIMGAIMITSLIHILSSILLGSIGRLSPLKLSRDTTILLAIELVVLLSVVFGLQLHIWHFIRITTLVIASSGFLGLLFLTPRFLSLARRNGMED
jgi:hypothetical protein